MSRTNQAKGPTPENETPKVASRDEAPVIEAAWLYYHQGLNQNEIAERLRISRASVVNYLSEARSRGWVRLYLDSDVFQSHQYSAQLCEAYGLSEVLVVPDDAAFSDELPRVARAAADWLPRLLSPGDRLGVSWGETVYSMARQMVSSPVDDLRVLQLLGSRPAAMGFAAEDCTSILAQKLDGLCINFHAPLLLSSSKVRDILSAEPAVAAQLAELAECNKTVFACGICNENAHVVQAGLIDADSILEYKTQGAVGVVCGRLIDAQGRAVRSDVEDRMIGVSLEEMRGKEMALLVAAGAGREEASRAAILGGYVTHLATSTRIAKHLLDAAA